MSSSSSSSFPMLLWETSSSQGCWLKKKNYIFSSEIVLDYCSKDFDHKKLCSNHTVSLCENSLAVAQGERVSQGVRVARLAGASYYDQVISIPRKPWTYAGSTGSDSDSRPRVDEFGKQSRAVNTVPRRCRSESPALIRTGPPRWNIFCGESPYQADLTPGSGVGARRRQRHRKT